MRRVTSGAVIGEDDQMTLTSAPRRENLSVYVQYEFMSARQVSEILGGIDGLYEAFVRAESGVAYSVDRDDSARLRIASIDTGNSLTLNLIQGIQQLVYSADIPTGAVVGAGGLALVWTARAIIGAFTHAARDIIELRTRHIALRQQIAEHKWQEWTRAVLTEQIQTGATPPRTDLQLRETSTTVARPLAATIAALADPNITSVRINDQPIDLFQRPESD
jgi:hypothetical protein